MPAVGIHRPPVKTGITVRFEEHLDLVRGKRVGLIANPTSLDSHLVSESEFYPAHHVKLVALYGPEHGVQAMPRQARPCRPISTKVTSCRFSVVRETSQLSRENSRSLTAPGVA